MKPLISFEDSELFIYPNFIESEEILEKLSLLPQKRPQGRMYGNDVSLNRNIILLSNVTEKYTVSNCDVDVQPLESKFKKLILNINNTLDRNFNGILINTFINGRDCIGSVNDSSEVFIFLGSQRKFRLRDSKTRKIEADILLNDSDLIFCTNKFMSKLRYEIPSQAKIKETSFLLIFKEISK